MSESAFGVEHGEVTKAFKMPGSFKPKMPKSPLASAGGAHRAAGPAKFAGAAKPPAAAKAFGMGAQAGTRAVGGAKKVGQSVGAGARRVGAAAQNNPGKSVTAAGLAGAGGGYTAYAMGRKKPEQR